MTRGAFRTAAAAASLAAGAPALAEDDSQLWLTVSAKGEIGPQIQLQTEGVARFSDDRGGLYQMQMIALLGYEAARGVTLWAGYVQSHEYSDGDLTIERRARQQITLDNLARLGRVTLSGRVRTEQRWRDGVDGTAWRIRPQLRATLALGGKSAPSLSLSEELFFNLNDPPFQSRDGLERARSAAALLIPLTPGVRGELGYLNQHRFVRGGPDSDEHALTAALAFSF